MEQADIAQRVTSPPIALPTPAEVLDALREAGWLLEQDTQTILQNHNFHTVASKAFPDPDEPSTSREIDVSAFRQFYRNEELSMSISARVIVECKQSSLPYVLIGRPPSAYEKRRNRKEQIFRFWRVEVGKTSKGNGSYSLEHVPAAEYLNLKDIEGSPWSNGFLATQMTRLDRKRGWQADNRGIFTSLIYPLAKAVSHSRSENSKSLSMADHHPGKEWANILFYYPLVVTSAPIFALDVSKQDLCPEIVPWATMTREIKTARIEGQFNVDVVTFDHLEAYIEERVVNFMNRVTDIAKLDPKRFVTRVDHSYNRDGGNDD